MFEGRVEKSLQLRLSTGVHTGKAAYSLPVSFLKLLTTVPLPDKRIATGRAEGK
jgi:hypothetical protein